MPRYATVRMLVCSVGLLTYTRIFPTEIRRSVLLFTS